MLSNGEIASLLFELARLTVLADGSAQSFRVRAYESAARTVESAAEPIGDLDEAALVAMRGIGRSTARKIRELVEKTLGRPPHIWVVMYSDYGYNPIAWFADELEARRWADTHYIDAKIGASGWDASHIWDVYVYVHMTP